MLRTKILGSSLVLLALGALSGCINDSVDSPQGASPTADGRLIRFTAGSSGGEMTRATTPYSGSFQVMADRTADDSPTGSSAWTAYMPDLTATQSGEVWTTSTSYYMPSSGTLRFYAYTSSQAEGVTALTPNSGRTADSAPVFTVADQQTRQYDLLTATASAAYSTDAPVNITFTHAMAAVWFSVKSGSMSGTISTVTIPDVSDGGTYTVDAGWGSLGSSADYAVSYGSYDSNTKLLLVIPQDLGGKTVTIQFTPMGGTLTNLTATLPNPLSLTAGNRYELQLNVSNDQVTITAASIANWTDPYEGSTPPDEFKQKVTK
mgnify:CR=1 FL=1